MGAPDLGQQPTPSSQDVPKLRGVIAATTHNGTLNSILKLTGGGGGEDAADAEEKKKKIMMIVLGLCAAYFFYTNFLETEDEYTVVPVSAGQVQSQ